MEIINTNIDCGYGNIIIIKIGVLTFYIPEFGSGWFDWEYYDNYYMRTGRVIITSEEDYNNKHLKDILIEVGYNFENTD